MRWEDERYVRLYTRDTLTWRLLRWQGRVTFCLLLRKVDRAGLLAVGDVDPGLALSEMLDLPEKVTKAGWANMLETGTAVLRNGVVCLPNFLEAQEAVASGKARTEAWRERRAARDVASTLSDNTSHPVTNGDADERAVTFVTPSCAVPSLAVPSLEKRALSDSSRQFEAEKPDQWPAGLLEQLRQALGRELLPTSDQGWIAFVAQSSQYPIAQRVAAAKEYLARKPKPGEHSPAYVLAMIARGAGPNGKNPPPPEPVPKWQLSGASSAEEYAGWLAAATADANGGRP